MVIRRSRCRSMVRVARIAGTAQAKPDIIGTKARPWSPIDFISRSIRKATRAM